MCQRTRSAGRKWLVVAGLFFCVGFTLACSQTYLTGVELTATAQTTVEAVEKTPELPTSTRQPTASSTLTHAPTRTRTPIPTKTSTPTIPTRPNDATAALIPPIIYYTQSGDTLPSLLIRFGVNLEEITMPEDVPDQGLIQPETLIVIPDVLGDVGPKEIIFPDSEVVFSRSALDFDTAKYINSANGFLASYKEELSSGMYTGAQLIHRVAIENSINPRLLLALLEYKSGWVFSKPGSITQTEYPLGYTDYHYVGLYRQLSWAVSQMSIGYYGWRAGLVTSIDFKDGSSIRLAPQLNAGTAAIQYLMAQLYTEPMRWMGSLSGPESLTAMYESMFGNPWIRAENVEPLYPTTLTQPELVLPFEAGHTWSYSGGPHSAWGPKGALAAVDFAPSSEEPGCAASTEWVVAVAPGKVVRSENGVVLLDLDGDGIEQTGWNILYLHIATQDRVPVGSILDVDDRIGHPSCEGGVATGTHVHIARKYNGEWILADGPVPFVLSGYTVHAGEADYLGTLIKGDIVVEAHTYGMYMTLITRPK